MSETGKLKTINYEDGKFEAGGKTYFIESQISVARYKFYVLYQTELGFGVTFVEILEQLKQIRDDAATLQFYRLCNRIEQLINAVAGYGSRKHPALAICALFCNTEDEDRTTFTAKMLDDKIEDFNEYDMGSFFALAATLVSGLADAWNDTWGDDDLPVPQVNKPIKK